MESAKDPKAALADAVAAHQAGDLARAEAGYGTLLEQRPGHPQVTYLMGALRSQQGRHAEALALLEAARDAAPGVPAILLHLGNALQGLGRFEEAAAAYDRAVAIKPDYDEAYNNRGNALVALGRPERALDSFGRALALKPDAGYRINRAAALMALDRFAEALTEYDRARPLAPDDSRLLNQSAMAALYACDWTRRAEIGARLEAAVRGGATGINPWTLVAYGSDEALLRQAARAMMGAAVPPALPPMWRGEKYGHDRIRIAYVSSDFQNHPVAFQLAQLLECHDRSRIELIGLSVSPDDRSAIRARIAKACDQFLDMAGAGAEEIARTLRAGEVDVAVDLNGYTAGNRMTAFAWRPAPVQAIWLGYPGTTGADFMDYLVGDAVVTPPATQPNYSETVVRLPGCFFPLDSGRTIGRAPGRAEAGLPDEGFVFCCFNRNWKITPDVFDIWMRLLKDVPGSVLWLRQYTASAGDILRREAQARGIAPERLVFAGRTATMDQHLARHALADLFLDTLPYGAHATAADALLAGLPVVTQLGNGFAGRVGASLVTAAGLPELAAPDAAAYERLALELARDPARLRALRERLATKAAPLFDTRKTARDLEAAYAWMLAEKT